MSLGSEMNWYAVQSKPHQEKLAAARVAKLDIETFLPMMPCEYVISGFARAGSKPLFRGYFFAFFSHALESDAVRFAQGVLRIVGARQFPIPLEPEIIAAIRDRIADDGLVHVETNGIRPGDTVSITQGPLCGWIGQVERELDDGRRVTILLDAINKARILIEKRQLAPAAF